MKSTIRKNKIKEKTFFYLCAANNREPERIDFVSWVLFPFFPLLLQYSTWYRFISTFARVHMDIFGCFWNEFNSLKTQYTAPIHFFCFFVNDIFYKFFPKNRTKIFEKCVFIYIYFLVGIIHSHSQQIKFGKTWLTSFRVCV